MEEKINEEAFSSEENIEDQKKADAAATEDLQEGLEPEESGNVAEDAEKAAAQEDKLEQAKRSLFSMNKKDKKEKKDEKKDDKKDEKIKELNDRLMRQMAEFDNFRKRTEREKSQMFEIGAKDVIEKILPTVDNFERGFAGLSEEELTTPFVMGMNKVYKQLVTTLEAIGVKPIEAVGQEFDPNLHNAVMHIEDEAFGENVIAEEFQKGYTYRDTVVRHSMVKVAN